MFSFRFLKMRFTLDYFFFFFCAVQQTYLIPSLIRWCNPCERILMRLFKPANFPGPQFLVYRKLTYICYHECWADPACPIDVSLSQLCFLLGICLPLCLHKIRVNRPVCCLFLGWNYLISRHRTGRWEQINQSGGGGMAVGGDAAQGKRLMKGASSSRLPLWAMSLSPTGSTLQVAENSYLRFIWPEGHKS